MRRFYDFVRAPGVGFSGTDSGPDMGPDIGTYRGPDRGTNQSTAGAPRFGTARHGGASASLLHMGRPALLLCLAVLLLVGGCARRPLPEYGSPARTWDVFQSHYRVRPSAPAFVAACSLAWSSGNRSARVLLDFWGGFRAPDPEAVVRMDAWTNLGGSLSKLRQGPEGLAAFYPDRMRAYTHADPIVGARLLGLPFPFSLADFAALLFGDFTDLVPAQYVRATPWEQGGILYEFEDARVDGLVLDRAARPVLMYGRTSVPAEYAETLGGQWRIEFSRYPEEAEPTGIPADAAAAHNGRSSRTPMAERLFLTLPGGHRGSLRIQSRELKLQPWSAQALGLSLPPDVEALALDGMVRDWTTGRVPASGGADVPSPAGEAFQPAGP